MGRRITLSCKKCGYTMDADVGSGLGSCLPAVIKETLKGEEMDKWNKLYESHELASFFGNMYVGYCPECMTLKNVFVVRGTKRDGSTVEFGGVCDTCACRCNLYEDEDIYCPKCKTDKLDVYMNGLWD